MCAVMGAVCLGPVPHFTARQTLILPCTSPVCYRHFGCCVACVLCAGAERAVPGAAGDVGHAEGPPGEVAGLSRLGRSQSTSFNSD